MEMLVVSFSEPMSRRLTNDLFIYLSGIFNTNARLLGCMHGTSYVNERVLDSTEFGLCLLIIYINFSFLSLPFLSFSVYFAFLYFTLPFISFSSFCLVHYCLLSVNMKPINNEMTGT